MKKRYFLVLASMIILSIFLISLISAADEFTDLNNQITDAQNQFEKIPKTPEDIKAEYLKQEWNKIFMTIPFIGPIHSFFLSHPVVFQILFNESYSISLTFILILILWIITAKVVHKPAKEGFNSSVAWTLAIGIPIIFAHLSIYKLIVSKTLYLIFAQETFWFRTILWFVVFFAVILILMLDEILTSKIKQSKEAKQKAELEQGIKESRTFINTLKDYLNIAKKNE